NLLTNAVNHTPVGKGVTIRVREQKGLIRVEVEDMGPGIAEEELPYIWERFYQTHKAGNRRSQGSGLGLAIVRAILAAHHIPYGVASVVGSGTTFWFEFSSIA
ncbi:MAG TPA: sensor histidine kinase, partial [Bacillota bacterium]|nr:sensor histidine kinase [Bacillota bacterium]